MLLEAFSRETYAGSSSGTKFVLREIGPGVGRGVGAGIGVVVGGVFVAVGTAVAVGTGVLSASGTATTGVDVGVGLSTLGVGTGVAASAPSTALSLRPGRGVIVAGADRIAAGVGSFGESVDCASMGARVAAGTSVGSTESTGLSESELVSVAAGTGVDSS